MNAYYLIMKNFRMRDRVFHFYSPSLLLRFVCVGAVGAVINLAVLIILVHVLHFHVTPAYLIALEVSIVSNFCLNNWFTFGAVSQTGSATKILIGKLVRFNVVSLAGATIAWLVFSLMFHYYGLNYVLADVCGILAATSWNYGLSKRLVWPHLTTPVVD